MGLRAKLAHYVEEIRFTAELTVGLASRLKLIGWLLAFHLQNALQARRRPAFLARIRTRITIRLPDGTSSPLIVRPFAGDLFVLFEVFLGRVYRLPGTILAEAAAIVDLGANIGLATLWLGSQAPRARIVAVEPVDANFSLLRDNVATLGERVTTVHGVIAKESGELVFYRTPESWGGSLFRTESAESTVVPAYEMEQIMARGTVDSLDVVKMDIEGAEAEILAGTPPWLDQVGTLIIELHRGYDEAALTADVGPSGLSVVAPSESGGRTEMVVATRRPDLLRRHGE